jgi:hypothetical protein
MIIFDNCSKYREWRNMYDREMGKMIKLNPCAICLNIIYLLKDNQLTKICESECELYKNYNKKLNQLKDFLLKIGGEKNEI